MPPMAWNEIERRARYFATRWAGETYERGESQTFWGELLTVYGIDRRRQGALFEYPIKKLSGHQGFIDLYWPGKLIVEQKSAGRDLGKALEQGLDYLPEMPDHELPTAIATSDFDRIEIFYLDPASRNRNRSFRVRDFPKNTRAFNFLFDATDVELAEQSEVNVKAAQDMATLHNELEKTGYRGHDLEVLLTRLVFCLFADDTTLIPHRWLDRFVGNRTRADGSDLGPWLIQIFDVLNTPEDQRQTNLDADLRQLPYVNGGLFRDPIRTPSFTSDTRHALLTAGTAKDWGQVSPAIFGSMFQGVMDPKERRNLGAHYTSERNILRVIQPLFLDALYAEFERVKTNPNRLLTFHDRIANLTFLDPACGCGNFLVVTYRELRRLEHKVIQLLHGDALSSADISHYLRVTVDQMYGIEIEEFPCEVAKLALWLTDHQMNLEASAQFGSYYARLPITSTPHIVNANALTTEWGSVVDLARLDYIMGNPPFNGSRTMSAEQKADLYQVTQGMREQGFLDFVTGWYFKAADIMAEYPHIRSAFVSTNSISQGEQVAILWKPLLERGVAIDFAHRTFKWTNDAKGVAAVYCVIVGFSMKGSKHPRIFEYEDIRGEPIEVAATNINPYLVDGPDAMVGTRQTPLCDVPAMQFGSMPRDGGNLILSAEEREQLIRKYPAADQWIRPYVGAHEFINGNWRYYLWLRKAPPEAIRSVPLIYERVEATREFRLASKAASTRKFGQTPPLFCQIAESSRDYVLVPGVSSERREYIPIGFMDASVIANNLVHMIPGATPYHFGILTSAMHMAWVRAVCGRLESRYRYSKDIVYNNFPWPEDVTDAGRAHIESLAGAVLAARELYPDSTLADLYDPVTMPAELRRAHTALDRAVDRLYRPDPFATDEDRVAHLFELYERLVAQP